MVLEKKKPGIIDYSDFSPKRFLASVSSLLCSPNLLDVNINLTVISVKKGSPNRFSSVLNTSQRICNKMKLFLNFILFCFSLVNC